MKLQLVYNEECELDFEKGDVKVEFKEIIKQLYDNYNKVYENFNMYRKMIKKISKDAENAQKNVLQNSFEKNNILDLVYLLFVVSPLAHKYSVNGYIPEKYHSIINNNDTESILILKLSYIKTVRDCLEKLNVKSQYCDSLINKIEKQSTITGIFAICDEVLFNGQDVLAKTATFIFIKVVASQIEKAYHFSEQYKNAHKSNRNTLEYMYNKVSNQEKLDFEVVKKIFDFKVDVSLDLKEMFKEENIKKYNDEIDAIRKNTNEEVHDETVITPSVKYEDSNTTLTQEDLECLDMYLKEVSKVGAGIIDIEDFYSKTCNYLVEFEDTNYKLILKELVRKVNNSTEIQGKKKTKIISAIKAQIRGI